MRKWMVYGLAAVMTLVLLQGIGSGNSPKVVQANAGTQWNAQYFNNIDLSGSPTVSRIDDKIDFNWAGGSPDGAIQADNFSARWTKTVNFPTSGSWTFRIGADDGIRMWIDATQLFNEWHGNASGYQTYQVTLDALTAGNHDLKVEYYEATGNAGVQVFWSSGSGSTTTTSGTGSSAAAGGPANWNAQYFNNNSLSGSPVVSRVDPDINFNWGAGSPDAAVPADNFSARWTTTVNFETPGHWHFTVSADDGVRMWIDVTPIIDQWHGSTSGTGVYEADIQGLTAGNHDLKVEYYEATGNAGIQVRWSNSGGAGSVAAAPAAPPVQPIYAAVTVTQLNVRTGPGRNYPVMAKVTYPKNYPVLGATPDMSWILIDLKNGKSGWVSNDWVWLFSSDSALNGDADGDTYQDFVFLIPRIDPGTVAAQAAAAAAANPAPAVTIQGRTSDVVNVRDGASLYAAQIIASLPQNTVVSIEARNGDGAWYLVSAPGGLRGWVNASFVVLTQGRVSDLLVSTEVVPAPAMGSVFVPQTDQGTTRTVRGRANSVLTFRDAASTRGNSLGEVAKGTEFVIEGRNTNGAWYLVTINGTQGWVYSPGVNLIEGAVSDLPIR